jgi:hypothetical protein
MGFSCTSLLTVLRLEKAAMATGNFILICDLGRRYIHIIVEGGATEIIRNLVPKLYSQGHYDFKCRRLLKVLFGLYKSAVPNTGKFKTTTSYHKCV